MASWESMKSGSQAKWHLLGVSSTRELAGSMANMAFKNFWSSSMFRWDSDMANESLSSRHPAR